MNIAILVYGRLDNFIDHYEPLMESLGKNNNIDFFLSSDNSPEIDTFLELYKPISYTNEKTYFPHDISIYNPPYGNGETSFPRMTSHFVNKKRVFSLLDTHIEKENKIYDIVISLRIDLYIESKFDFSDIEENTIYIPLGQDHKGGYNDQLAYGKIDAMRKYSYLLDNIIEILDKKLSIPHPENLTKANIIFNNLQVKRFDLEYLIDKENRQWNKVFGHGKFVSEIQFMVIADFIYQGDLYLDYSEKKLFKPSRMFDKCIIYINLNFVHHFIDMIKDNTCRYVLISGYSDYSVPYLREPERYYGTDILLNDPNLICWFGANKIINHPKIRHIPIGVPNTIPNVRYDNERGDFTEWIYHIDSQNIIENFLRHKSEQISIIGNMRNKRNSDKLIHISFTISKTDTGLPSIRRYDNHRRYLDQYIREKTPFEHIQLSDWFRNIAAIQEYKYSLCPHAKSPDSYRIWESLIVGTVPVVFSSPIDELYQDLPVLVLDNFYQLNEQYLNEQYDIIISRDDYNFDKLLKTYWLNVIRDTQNSHLKILT